MIKFDRSSNRVYKYTKYNNGLDCEEKHCLYNLQLTNEILEIRLKKINRTHGIYINIIYMEKNKEADIHHTMGGPRGG